ncbi:hypothetical protein ACFL5Z_02315 [Planctomycetota bacterium]
MAVNLEIVKELVQSKCPGKSDARQDIKTICPADLPIEWRIEYEERAAILQYDGGLNREEADRQAFVEIVRRLKKFGKY